MPVPHLSLTTLSQSGFTLDPPLRTSDTTYHYPVVHRDPRTHERSPIVCQTPWLWLPLAPRYICRQKRRFYFVHPIFWNDHPEQLLLLNFLRGIQKSLLRWLRRNPPPESNVGADRDRTDRPPVALPALEWAQVLEYDTHTPKFAFTDEHATRLRRSRRLRQRRTSDDHAPPPRRASQRVKWRISTHLSKAVHCYDAAKERTSMDPYLTAAAFTPRYVRLMVQFSHVWVNQHTRTAGLGLNILQIQHSDVEPLRTFAFLDVLPAYQRERPPMADSETQTASVVVTAGAGAGAGAVASPGAGTSAGAGESGRRKASERCDHPVYGKYFKMCAKGVPKPAVQHKMRMNGVDPCILDLPEGAPLPAADTVETGDDDQLSLSLQDTQQLRKTEVNADRPKQASGGAGHGFSLSEIVNGLQSLRKTFFRTTDTATDGPEGEPTPSPTTTTRTDAPTTSARSRASSSLLSLLSTKYGA